MSRAIGVSWLFAAACGGAQAPATEEPEAPPPTSPTEEPDDGIQIEGQMGTISQMAVESALTTQLERLGGCYRQSLAQAPYLVGDVVLSFRIARDGSVRWVYPISSTIGHQATQSCILERARSIHFSRPVGGEADVSYPMAFNPGGGRPPDVWPAERATDAIGEHREEISGCGLSGDGYSLTLYVQSGGRVVAAGVSYPSPEAATAADCVSNAAASWTMPDPGSWVAKVTVDL